jgi:hypothetical protein
MRGDQRCLFCRSRLGRNETVEAFQTGRRIAFDQQKGRLWVVCRACDRWNLAPLEERWEAIEQCERAFRDTALRKNTGNIGLARMPDGTDLIRVGQPLLPELAAWRYTSELVRRYRWNERMTWVGTAGPFAYYALYAAHVITGATLPIAVPIAFGMTALGGLGTHLYLSRKFGGRSNVVMPGGVLKVRSADAGSMRVLSDGHDGWKLRLPHTKGVAELTGPNAVFAAGLVLPRLTWRMASPAEVEQAVRRITAAGSPERLLASIARENQGRYGTLRTPDAMIAVEISANESAESEHLAAHLRLLEAQWREAEEIAAIADSLLVDERVERRLGELKQRLVSSGSSVPPGTPPARQ